MWKTALTPVLHPANNCSAVVRKQTASRICAKLYELGISQESEYLNYLAVALPSLGKSSGKELAKYFAGLPLSENA